MNPKHGLGRGLGALFGALCRHYPGNSAWHAGIGDR